MLLEAYASPAGICAVEFGGFASALFEAFAGVASCSSAFHGGFSFGVSGCTGSGLDLPVLTGLEASFFRSGC